MAQEKLIKEQRKDKRTEQMKELYERPDFEIIELEGEVATLSTLKDSNETDIIPLDMEEFL